MKKMLICCGVLCMTLFLFCGSALAAVEVKPGDDASVTITKNADETVFTVTKSGTSDGQLYLVMIQKGDATAKPTAENLYYLNVDKASGTSFTMDAYPKDLDEGTYVVYLSDYAGSNNGARKQVATLSVTGNGGGSTTPGGTGKRGDVDGKEGIDVNDAIYILKYLANMEGYDLTGNSNANVDGKGGIDVNDAIYILKYLANMEGYDL